MFSPLINLFLYSIFFYLSPSFGLKVYLPFHQKKCKKGKRSQKLIHLDLGMECHLSTRQKKKMVWSLLNKKNDK